MASKQKLPKFQNISQFIHGDELSERSSDSAEDLKIASVRKEPIYKVPTEYIPISKCVQNLCGSCKIYTYHGAFSFDMLKKKILSDWFPGHPIYQFNFVIVEATIPPMIRRLFIRDHNKREMYKKMSWLQGPYLYIEHNFCVLVCFKFLMYLYDFTARSDVGISLKTTDTIYHIDKI